MAQSSLTIILAAGEGTRMRSATPKVLHQIAGLSMIGHVVAAVQASGKTDIAVVIGRDAEAVMAAVGESENTSFHVQEQRLGTAHAVLAARDAIERGYDDVTVLFADTPLIESDTLAQMRQQIANGSDIAVLGFCAKNPTGYGRLIGTDGEITAIREEHECSKEERAIKFCNGGIMAFTGRDLPKQLEAIGNDNAKGEYYLTDMVEIARRTDREVIAIMGDENEILGINNRVQLAEVEAIWQRRRREHLMVQGVSMQAPETVFLSHDTEIGQDSALEPHIVFGPGVSIGEGVQVRAYCHIEGTQIAANATIGPFARLRPGANLSEHAKVGNFCEVKNATIEAGAKVNHLSYIGDARIGKGANIGAGTITCNYDGVNKHRTHIGAGCFIGSNSSLVAPVAIGARAYVASGTVVTHDVPVDGLAIGRCRQSNKNGMGRKIRDRNAALKAARNNQLEGGEVGPRQKTRGKHL